MQYCSCRGVFFSALLEFLLKFFPNSESSSHKIWVNICLKSCIFLSLFILERIYVTVDLVLFASGSWSTLLGCILIKSTTPLQKNDLANFRKSDRFAFDILIHYLMILRILRICSSLVFALEIFFVLPF